MPTSDASPTLDLEALRTALDGTVLEPGHAGYDEGRAVWNARFDPRPTAIVRCRSTGDVALAVRFAREHGLPLSVKGGGHSYAGHSVIDGALALDLGPMNEVRIDSERKRATVGPGAMWAELDREAQAVGLATTGATVSTVGVSGFLLGGGTGYLTRKYGLGVDNLLGAEVVTADGSVVRASDHEHTDLFWALRGGGGNFGVVTEFEVRLHEVGPEVGTAQAFYPMSEAASVLRAYRDYMRGAPDEVNAYAFVLRTPPVDPFPEAFQGEPCVALVACHCGGPAEAEAALGPLLEFGEPFLAALQTVPYTTAQQAFDAGMPKGLRWYSRALDLARLPDEAIETVMNFTRDLPGPFTMAYFEGGGGAPARVGAGETAFASRDAAFGMHIFPGWTDPSQDQAMMDWARAFHEAMSPHATGCVYVNLMGEDEGERVPAAYGRNYERLVAVKSKWDPENVFRANHNIPPR